MMPQAAAWVTLFAPAMAGFGIILFTRRSRALSAGLAIGAMALGFLCALWTLLAFPHLEEGHTTLQMSVPWVNVPGLTFEFGILLDPLAILMSLVVTSVGLLIFIYSVGYMAEDPGFTRYFAFLSLFAFSMLGIVYANNFVTLFLFWELVGASSYLLIGFWYQRPKAAEAGKKAFLVNRIADFGFLLGILTIWSLSGGTGEPRTLNFPELSHRLGILAQGGILSPTLLGIVGALIFCGVVGKSAQFPLHVWLPDAMEGPTPVSALIHAATMVAAGVYLLARVFFLFSMSQPLMDAIALCGAFTALFAASLALVENDIKRILAYSTLSQLGTMVMALGLGGLVPGMYHLTTHAFFKALLFLGAGCVIHALHTNDIRRMGGLTRSMPVTSLTFFIASLALAGFWPLSGFFSKEEILTLAFTHHRFLWALATITAGTTAFYMGRLFCAAFLAPARSEEDPPQSAEAPGSASPSRSQEAPAVMTVPLMILAVLSVAAGGFKVPAFLHHAGGEHVRFNLNIAILSNLVALGAAALAFAVYARGWRPGPQAREAFEWLYKILLRKYGIDEAYAWVNRNVQQRLAIWISKFERYVIIGLWVNGTAKMTGLAGETLRRAQTGNVQAYALSLLTGLAAVMVACGRWR